MKRMNEVFELPVNPEDFTDPCYPNEKDEHVYIAHAINHVDALADALEAVLPFIDKNELGKFGLKAYDAAELALNAYRGAK